MCGVIGYIGKHDATPILFKGLKRLEYRGYDSAGIATLGSGFHIKKDAGKVDEIHQRMNFLDIPGSLGIAHTRWATHGGVTKENAHPHLDCDEKIAVVHNGIIENYQELKRNLVTAGHRFKSQTDTEILPHLIEEIMKKGKNFHDATISALRSLEGSYAFLILNRNERKLIAARKGSPLVLGVSNEGYFAASDIPAFLEHTKNVVYISDYDVALVTDDGFKIFNLAENREVDRKIDTVDWDIKQAEKGEFEHFMLKEISEQVDTIQRAAHQNRELIDHVVKEIRNARGIFFVAAGSSYHACLAASYIMSKVSKLHINVVLGSEFPHYEHYLTEKSLIIAVSQSGETADVLEAVKSAKANRSKVISLVNAVGSSLTRTSDMFLNINAGPEISVLSTKTYTSQLALFTLLSYALTDKYDEGKRKLTQLWNEIYHLTSATTREKIKELAERLQNKHHIFLIGRGLQYATALEAALKIKEVSYIHAEALAAGELKHGTIALIENGTPCIVFVSEENEKEVLSNAMEVKSRGGYIIGISPRNNDIFDFWVKVPEVNNENPIVQIIPIQILAYQLAILRGLDPDRPRNLAKSVTVK